MVDNLQNWWNTTTELEQEKIKLIQLKVDNGSENSGVRTQFLNRLVAFSDQIGTSIQLLYYPPIERWLGDFGAALEWHIVDGCDHPLIPGLGV